MENSKLTNCNVCHKFVAKTAKICVHCGQPNPSLKLGELTLEEKSIGCSWVIVIIIVITCGIVC